MKFQPLTEIESKTYDVLSSFLRKYRELDLAGILPYCYKSHLRKNYSEAEITKAVNSLIKKRYFIRGSSLSRADILQNPVRKRLLKFIQIHPGAYNRQIRRELNIGSNEFNWHTGMLEKFGFIKKVYFTARSYGYFEDKSYMGHELDLFLMQNPKVKAILDYLDTNKAALSQISKDLEMHYSTTQKYLRQLLKRDIIRLTSSLENHHLQYYYLNDDILIKLKKIVNGQVFVDFADPYEVKT